MRMRRKKQIKLRSGNIFFLKLKKRRKSREKDELLKTKFCSWDFVMGAVIAIDLFYLLFYFFYYSFIKLKFNLIWFSITELRIQAGKVFFLLNRKCISLIFIEIGNGIKRSIMYFARGKLDIKVASSA